MAPAHTLLTTAIKPRQQLVAAPIVAKLGARTQLAASVWLAAAAAALHPGAAQAQTCLNDSDGHASELCLVDPTDLSARTDGATSIAFERPARRVPQDDTLPSISAKPLAVAAFEVDGSPPPAGAVQDAVFLDQAGVWVMPNNDPVPNSFMIEDEEENAYLAIPLAHLLDGCATEDPPCPLDLPNVTAGFLAKGDFDDDGSEDLAVYIQTDENPTGPEGTLVYLEVAPAGGLQIQRRHPSIGGDAVDLLVADFDGDDADDAALLYEEHLEVICDSTCPSFSLGGLKLSIAFHLADVDNDGGRDLVVLGAADTSDTYLLAFAIHTGSGFSSGPELTVPKVDGDVLTDIAAERLLEGEDDLVVLVTADAGDVGWVYWYPLETDTLTPRLAAPTVTAFPGGARKILLADVGPQTPRQFVSATELTAALPTDITVQDGALDVLVVGNGAPFTDAVEGEKDLRVGMLTVLQGPFSESEVVIDVPPGQPGGFVTTNLVSSQWRLASLLDDDVDEGELEQRRITDIAIGELDLTEGPDLIISDAAEGELIFVRAQPPPCATYVTFATHGNIGIFSHLPGVDLEYQESIDRMLTSLRVRSQIINDERRPGLPDVAESCPIRHLEVRGHWEAATRAGGAQTAVLGARASWILSQYGIGAVYLPTITWLVGPTPLSYWATYAALGVVPTVPLMGTRATLGILAGALELTSRQPLATAASEVVGEFQAGLHFAARRARQGMDACGGQIYVDAIGYSRGGPIVNRMLNPVEGEFASGANIRFNAKVRTTYIDPISAEHEHQPVLRPWSLAGDMQNDGPMRRRGNERTSAFFAASPELNNATDLFIEGLIAPFELLYNEDNYPLRYAHSHVCAIPLGWDQEDELSFAAKFPLFCSGAACSEFESEEVFAGPIGTTHSEIKWVEGPTGPPTGFFAPGDVLQSSFPGAPGDFHHAATSSLGVLLQDATAFGVPPDELGWAPRGAAANGPDDPFFRTANDEREDLPEVCGGGSTNDPFEQVGMVDVCVFNPEGPVSSECEWTREMVDDEFWSGSTSALLAAEDLRGREWQELEDAFEGIDFPQELEDAFNDMLQEIVQVEMPPDGAWQQPEECHDAGGLRTKCPEGVGLRGQPLDNGQRVMDALVEGVPGSDEEEIAANAVLEMEAMSPRERQDRIAYFTSLLSGASPGGKESFALFPEEEVGEVFQKLPHASKASDELVVRLELEFVDEDGFVEVGLTGDGLDEAKHIACADGWARRQETFLIDREIAPETPALDTVHVHGRGVRVHRVSVQPHRVLVDPLTARMFELVYRTGGTSWDHADDLTRDLRYFDYQARLAPPDADAIAFVESTYEVESPVWMGASRAAGSGVPFLRADGTTVPSGLWASGVSPPLDSNRALYAMYDPAAGGLNYLEGAVTYEGTPIAYLVEYVAPSDLTCEEASEPSVVIQQIYGAGGNTGADYANDFVTLHNRGDAPVNLTHWTLQYASAEGSNWSRAYLDGTIAPGAYYLVELFGGAQGGYSLPTPDATAGLNLHATTGKVALVSGSPALTGACPFGPNVVEVVGYGSSANCYQGSGPAPGPAAPTEGVQRSEESCGVACEAAADFTVEIAVPLHGGSSPELCEE